jgi:hypothetical protein
MKRIFPAALLCAIVVSMPFARPQTAAVVSLANEKVFINPPLDSSALQSFDGWPREKKYQDLLSVHFRDLHKNVIAEFKRSEKYGFYEVVDDSSAATVRLRLIVEPYSYKKDTLTLPVRVELRHKAGVDTYSNTILAQGVYRTKSKPKSPFHLLDYLLSDFRRHFPYKKLSALFCPPVQ